MRDLHQRLVPEAGTDDEDRSAVGQAGIPSASVGHAQLGSERRIGRQTRGLSGPSDSSQKSLRPSVVMAHVHGQERKSGQDAGEYHEHGPNRSRARGVDANGPGLAAAGHRYSFGLYGGRSARTTPAAPELSVVIPVYNEQENIRAVVRAASSYLDRLGVRFEIDVVDDGSTDATPAVLQRLQAEEPRLRTLRHDRNRGYGAAVRSGLQHARGRYVLLIDGDGQFRIEALAGLWPEREKVDLVLGYRERRADPPWRKAAGWIFSRVFVRLFFGGGYRDVNCGFKLIARRVLERIELSATGALISAELLTRARLAGATWVEKPVPHFPRRYGRATGLRPRVLWGVIRELLAVRRNALMGKRHSVACLRPCCDPLESTSL